MDISASVVKSASTRTPLQQEDLVNPNIDSRLAMAGIHYQFLRKWALLGGFQQATLTLPVRQIVGKAKDSTVFYLLDDLESDFRIGLEYSLGRHAYLMVSGGRIDVKRTFAHQGDMPAGTGRDPARDILNDFSQTLSQATIRVKF